jgi:hypothetical protein
MLPVAPHVVPLLASLFAPPEPLPVPVPDPVPVDVSLVDPPQLSEDNAIASRYQQRRFIVASSEQILLFGKRDLTAERAKSTLPERFLAGSTKSAVSRSTSR